MVSTLLIHTMIFKSLTLRRKTLIRLTFSIGSQGGLSKLFLYFAKNPHKIKGHSRKRRQSFMPRFLPHSLCKHFSTLLCPASRPICCFLQRRQMPSPILLYYTLLSVLSSPLRQPAIPILKISHIIGVAMGNSRFTKACAP